MQLLPGAILNKRYRIVSLLGSGAYGAVYRAWDTVSKLDVAVKEYLDPSVETQKRFRAEVRRLSRLAHPQLPAVLDHFALEESGQYLVTAYVDGVDLQSLMAQYGRLPTDQIINWLQAACQPLAYLHAQNQLHLNIKPANLRMTPDGKVFLVDSGLPGLGIRPAENGYGSPEQQNQQDVVPASDIYSLGATLYSLLTNQLPPNALSRESGLKELVPAREINQDVEPYLSIVANRAMSLRADTRYESADAFAQALARPVGQPAPESPPLQRTSAQVSVPPPPRIPPSRRRQMERRTMFALLAILAVVILAGIGMSVFNLGVRSDVTEAEATATLQSAVVAALTAIAPTPSQPPAPTIPPTPTPEPFVADTGARMIFIPGGVFLMGKDDVEEADQSPAHLVRMDPFFIDETEVTNGEYAQCVAAGGCNPPNSPNATTHRSYYGDLAFDDYPVIFVDWYAADTFCRWRNGRLPSEAEWEMAASFDAEQGLKLTYPWGEAFDGQKLNYCDSKCPLEKRDARVDDGHQDTAAVGSYVDGRSPSNIYDMSGNVMEWINDWYDPKAYQDAPDRNPLGPVDGEFKTLRGGSWLSAADEVTTTARGSFDPLVARANLGFRCVMTPP